MFACADAALQTNLCPTAPVATQTETVQPPPVERQEVGIQASELAPEAARTAEASTQVDKALPAEAGVQVGQPAALAHAVASQTQPPPLPEIGIQAGGGDDVFVRDFAIQTEMLEEPQPRRRQPPLVPAAVQTEIPPSASRAVQAAPRGVDRGTQKEDSQAAAREAELSKLEARVKSLVAEAAELSDGLRTTQEGEEAWKKMAQSQALGRLNITILCPRAECTVNGDRLEMDSWDPTKLREEFERDVLPRFSRVFVEVEPAGAGTGGGGQKKDRPRPEVVEKTMQEFADVFRKRLSTMLAAPSAAAAVAAAGAGPMTQTRSGR